MDKNYHILAESKADTQRLIDFAGPDLANRFLNIKNKLKAPENDLYYWIKEKTATELELFVQQIEQIKSVTQAKKSNINSGAKLIQDTPHWKVYHITSFEASQIFGRDTKWCITGINNTGSKYYDGYVQQGVNFYFAITKNDYDSRGEDSKFAFAVYPGGFTEIFNQQDSQVSYVEVPYIEEIQIPGADIESATANKWYCSDCGIGMEDDQYYIDPDGDIYCEKCFFDFCFFCDTCGSAEYNENISIADDTAMCRVCARDLAEKEQGHDYSKLNSSRNTGYEAIAGRKLTTNFGVHVEDALNDILNFINKLNPEEKSKFTLRWHCINPDETPYSSTDLWSAYTGTAVVSVQKDMPGQTESNYDEAEQKIRKALGLPEKVYEEYSLAKEFMEYDTLWENLV